MIDAFLFQKVPSDYMLIFSKIFALSILFKNTLEVYRGYWSYLDSENYLGFLLNSNRKYNIGRIYFYKIQFVIKAIAPLFILFTFKPEVASLFLSFAFLIEMYFYFKYHANLMFLYFCIFTIFFFQQNFKNETIIIFPLMMTLTTSAVYFFSAIHKTNRAFLSGDVIIKTIELVKQSERRYFDFYKILNISITQKKISGLMYLTIIIEFILPFLLYSSAYKVLGIFLGACMHVGFTIMFPVTLLHFSVLSVSSYLLFFYF